MTSSGFAQYSVEIAPSARGRLSAHIAFLARVSEEAASRLFDGIVESIQSLERYPLRCPVFRKRGEPIGKYRCLISMTRYRIVYQVKGDKVFVEDIQDCRQAISKRKKRHGFF